MEALMLAFCEKLDFNFLINFLICVVVIVSNFIPLSDLI